MDTSLKTPVYAVVRKSTKKKPVDSSDEKVNLFSGDRSQIYSKVDKAKRRAEDVDPPSGVPTQDNRDPQVGRPHVAMEPRDISSVVSEGGYESINYDRARRVEDDYDTVGDNLGYDSAGDDFGYDSVDSVAEKANCLPSLETLKRAPEHIYSVVPENINDLTQPKSLSSDVCMDVAEVPT